MRAFLIDAYTQTTNEFDFDDDYRNPKEILGSEDAGDFTVGSGPLNTPRRDEDIENGTDRMADYLYVRAWGHQDGLAEDGDIEPIPEEIEGDPRHWFQIDTDRAQPSTFPVPGRGLVVDVAAGTPRSASKNSKRACHSRAANCAATPLYRGSSRARSGSAPMRRSSWTRRRECHDRR